MNIDLPTLINKFISEFFEVSDNPFSAFFLYLIIATIALLILAIWIDGVRKFLVSIYVLEKNEDPKSFLKWIVSVIVIIRLVHILLIQPFLVDGESMSPNFQTNDLLLINKISYYLHPPVREDVIVFKFLKADSPLNGKYFIKRLIGLPGEKIHIQNGSTTITTVDGKTINLSEKYVVYPKTDTITDITLKNDEYFVMGDNRAGSYDSRSWGPIHFSQISGKALVELINNPTLNPASIDKFK
jgi:signal peptidase I